MVIADVMPMLEQAAATDGCYPVDHYVRNLYQGKFQLWAAIEDKTYQAICLTEVLSYPNLRSVNIVAVVGQDHTNWLGFISDIEDAARSVGIDRVEITARPGFKRLLKDYRMTAIVLTKELNGKI
jgi:hypothetical protein